MLRKFTVPILACLALTAGFLFHQQSTGSTQPTPFNPFSLPDLGGIEHSSDEWAGKVVIFNFWASWCGPCLEEIPDFIALQDSYSAQGLQFIGIAIDNPEAVQTFQQKLGINYPILMAPDEGVALSSRLGNTMGILPFSIVVDRNGQVVHQQLGLFKHDQIVETIEPLLAASTTKNAG